MEIIINTLPIAKQSDKSRIIRKSDGTMFIAHYQKKAIKDEENKIKVIVKSQLPDNFKPYTGAVHVNKLHYIFPIPKSFTKAQYNAIINGEIIEKITKPDLTDNLNKLLFDALEDVIYINDSQISVMNNVRKYYGIEPKIIIDISGE